MSQQNELKSTLISRNITIQGRRTSIRLEPEMWSSLSEIAKREKCSAHDVCSLVSLRKKENTSLTAAIRVFIMLYFRAATTETGHERAGHGDLRYMRVRAGVAASAAKSRGDRRLVHNSVQTNASQMQQAV